MASEDEKQYINAVLEGVWESAPIKRRELWRQFLKSDYSTPDYSKDLWSSCSRLPASHPCQEMWSLLQSEIGDYIRAFILAKIRADEEKKALSERHTLSNVEQLLDDPKASNPMPQTRSMGLTPHPRIPYRPNVRLLKRITNVDEINPNENYLLVVKLGNSLTTTYLGKFVAQTTMKAQFEKTGIPTDPSDWTQTHMMINIDKDQAANPINAASGGYYIYLCDPLGQLIIDGMQDPNNVVNPISLAAIINSIPLPQDVQRQVALSLFKSGPARQGDQGGGQSRKARKAIKAREAIKARKSRRRQSRRRRRSKK